MSVPATGEGVRAPSDASLGRLGGSGMAEGATALSATPMPAELTALRLVFLGLELCVCEDAGVSQLLELR
jgi:hypothetical protein